ncbi:MAG: NUDIX hydrolase [Sneathiella sp.]|nr:NUDIX hydrolase [Sneathiella sp.]
MSYRYDYPRPALTTDVVAFTMREGSAHILLICRACDPFKGSWAFPGGFVDENEDLLTGALRGLQEETGLVGISIEQFHTFGEPGRDPRGHTVSVAYVGIVPQERQKVIAADDAADARWFPVSDLPPLAFDHSEMLKKAVSFLKVKFEQKAELTSERTLGFSRGDLQVALKHF